MDYYNVDIMEFVLDAHGNQMYGDILPYIVHLIMVMRHFLDPKKQAIALLHDILEDTKIDYQTLGMIFGKEIADTVLLLTRKEGEEYFDYIEKIKENPLATEIKIADLEENIFASKCQFSWKKYSTDRYEKALKILKGEKNE